jgi:transcriptional regulator with XRE-family HTH domain
MESFGLIIQEARRKKGWSIIEFIYELGIDCSTNYMTKVELRGEIPDPVIVYKMADVLNLNHEYLVDIAKRTKKNIACEYIERRFHRAKEYYMGFKT